MRPKTGAFYIFITLVLLGLIAVSAYSLTQYLRLRENRRLVEQQLADEIQNILGHCRNQILRHPDYDLDSERLFVTSFAQAAPKDQVRDLDKLKAFSGELTEKLLLQAAGIKPGDDRWSEVVRYKTYSPNGFKDLHEQMDYPRVEQIQEVPAITGDPVADQRIVALAVRRGYRLRQQADEYALVSDGDHMLQEAAMGAWRELQSAARNEGIQLELVSGYRSVEHQRQIFLRELGRLALQTTGREYTAETIATGEADRWVEEVLQYSSIPGYSKHHSGYTIDISDPSQGHSFTDFEQTSGFVWISGRNYLNAKRFGFVPSYPIGADKQGPEPEPWEYVWVGLDRLRLEPERER
ncbi:MAG: M15 family metallopeptidase [Spirochaetaceae bacterium]|nr:MAG: M15 family metallopeptidase [Spirochaetaceae bacterium]